MKYDSVAVTLWPFTKVALIGWKINSSMTQNKPNKHMLRAEDGYVVIVEYGLTD
jgi:hypothetical protein